MVYPLDSPPVNIMLLYSENIAGSKKVRSCFFLLLIVFNIHFPKIIRKNDATKHFKSTLKILKLAKN